MPGVFKKMAALSFCLLSSCAAGTHAPPFASVPYEPFSRSAAVAVALREWRLWGSQVEHDGGAGYVQHAATMAERQQGLWQRVGEYWWEGMPAGEPDARWTGKHDGAGKIFPVAKNGDFAWSAAFISYVMRIAGAGAHFPYAPDHATYINYAARPYRPGKLLIAENPKDYAPRLGDLVCFPRGRARNLTFQDLPTSFLFPAHCAVVTGGGPGRVDVVGGNVEDSVMMEKLHADAQGRLAGNQENWFVVLRVLYARN
ncbi:DUF2272 domain-containing protein [Acidocella sp.]|uniref:DUF2272 domain-containing protein n=1 Tax=Acidocella sp. TaxID=50710 RepID=UPI003D00D98D